MTSKTCTKCGLDKDFSNYNKAKLGKLGLTSVCKPCIAVQAVDYQKRAKHRISEYGKKYRKEKANRISIQRAAHTLANKERLGSYARNWGQANPGKVNAKTAKRRAAKRNATPKWLSKEHLKQIESFYLESTRLTKETGVKYEVDHIVPILGKNVMGLHVPWNLRVVTRSENRKKSYKF